MKEGILKELGLRKGWIYEVLVTTSGTRGKRNSAPMGVWTDDFSVIFMEVYKDSGTYRNLADSGEFVIDFVDEVGFFYEALDSGLSDPERAGIFRIAARVRNVRNKRCSAVFASEIVAHAPPGKIGKIRLINRAEHLALEALILSTKRPPDRKTMRECLRVIKKVAPESEYEKIVRKLLR